MSYNAFVGFCLFLSDKLSTQWHFLEHPYTNMAAPETRSEDYAVLLS